MAINYRWTKIYNDTDLAADTPGAYTFLEGASNNTYNGATGNQDINTFAPKIYISANYQNDRGNAKLLGRILTDRTDNGSEHVYTQKISQPWIFLAKEGITSPIINYYTITLGDNGQETRTDYGKVDLQNGVKLQYNGSIDLANFTETSISLKKSTTLEDALSVAKNTILNNTLEVKETTILQKKLSVYSGGVSISGDSTVTGKWDVDGLCEATYFNATSDLRAKKDINEHDFSDAFINDILESICTYHFKKDASNDPIFIGLIAQRVISICTKHNVDPRIFVNHLEATGENGDYMSLNINNLMFLFALGLRHEKSKQIDLAARIKQLEEKING